MTATPAQVVADRLQCLFTHFVRGWAEAKHRKLPGADKQFKSHTARQLFELSRDSLAHPGLRRAFTPRERKTIALPLGKLGVSRTVEATFRAEPIAVLAWALGHGDVPTSWEAIPSTAYRDLKPENAVGEKLPAFLATPRLRTRRDLQARRGYEHVWAWRVRMEGLQLTIALASSDDGMDHAPGTAELFRSEVAKRAKLAEAKKWLKRIGNDFPFRGRPFSKVFAASAYPGRDFEAFANERLRVANWLLRPTQNWHRVSTMTPLGFVLPKRMIGDARFLKAYLDPSDDSHWY
jgi:hypothetical protein